MSGRLAPEVASYLQELGARLLDLLGDNLTAVYCGGSLALGGYRSGSSDIDVVALSGISSPAEVRQAVIDNLRHEALPCPARGLEFVLFALPEIGASPGQPAYDVELNDGPGMTFAAYTDPRRRPTAQGRFWYGLDLAILRQSGIALYGPPAPEVLPPIPRDQLLALLLQSLDWHLEHGDEAGADVRLNACRTRYFVRYDRWVSKQEAAVLDVPELSTGDLLAQIRVEVAAGARGRGPTGSDRRS